MTGQEEKILYRTYPDIYFGGFWIRFFAYLVDSLIISALANIIANPIAVIFNMDMYAKFPSPYAFLRLLVYLGYFVLMTKLNHGQTLGKMLFNLRVVPMKEKNLTWSSVLVREAAGRYIEKIFFIIQLIIPFTEHHQSLADLFADTGVIRDRMLEAEKYCYSNFEEKQQKFF